MGGVGSGGAHGGPQYSPMNISATGGNGQSGNQPARYISGLPYGQGQATMQQQQSAPMASQPQVKPGSVTPVTPMGMETMPITAPSTRPNEPITAGAAVGAGPGTEALTLPSTMQQDEDPDMNMVRTYFPILEYWAAQPGTSQATKDYVQFLRGII